MSGKRDETERCGRLVDDAKQAATAAATDLKTLNDTKQQAASAKDGG